MTGGSPSPPASPLLVHGAGSGPWIYEGCREAIAEFLGVTRPVGAG